MWSSCRRLALLKRSTVGQPTLEAGSKEWHAGDGGEGTVAFQAFQGSGKDLPKKEPGISTFQKCLWLNDFHMLSCS